MHTIMITETKVSKVSRFSNGAKTSGFDMCFCYFHWIPAPKVPKVAGVPIKALESSINMFEPHGFLFFSRP